MDRTSIFDNYIYTCRLDRQMWMSRPDILADATSYFAIFSKNKASTILEYLESLLENLYKPDLFFLYKFKIND